MFDANNLCCFALQRYNIQLYLSRGLRKFNIILCLGACDWGGKQGAAVVSGGSISKSTFRGYPGEGSRRFSNRRSEDGRRWTAVVLGGSIPKSTFRRYVVLSSIFKSTFPESEIALPRFFGDFEIVVPRWQSRVGSVEPRVRRSCGGVRRPYPAWLCKRSALILSSARGYNPGWRTCSLRGRCYGRQASIR